MPFSGMRVEFELPELVLQKAVSVALEVVTPIWMFPQRCWNELVPPEFVRFPY